MVKRERVFKLNWGIFKKCTNSLDIEDSFVYNSRPQTLSFNCLLTSR